MHLAHALLSASPELQTYMRVECVELEPDSVAVCEGNWARALFGVPVRVRGMACEALDPGEVNHSDLLVCNPPYILAPAGMPLRSQFQDSAVFGVRLIQWLCELVACSHATLLLVVSSTGLPVNPPASCANHT